MRHPRHRVFCAFLSLLALFAVPAMAAVPHIIPVQGRLTNTTGDFLDGNYDINFFIYDVQSGGSALYTEVHGDANQVSVSTGFFAVTLGELTTLPLDFNRQFYLGIKVGSDSEMSPRIKLTSAPYALTAGTLSPYADVNVDSGTLFIDISNNRVGVGTTSPTNKFQVVDGNVLFDLDNNGAIKIADIPTAGMSPGKIELGRSTFEGSGWESIAFDPTIDDDDNHPGAFVFSAPLYVPEGSPAITFFDPDDPDNNSKKRSIMYNPDINQLRLGDSFYTNFGQGTGNPASGKTFFRIGSRELSGAANAGTFFGFNTGGSFTGDLFHAQVGNVPRFRVTRFGDIITRGGVMTSNAPLLNQGQVWNNAGVTFTAWDLNITDTNSAAGSKLIDLKVGGTSQFVVLKDGNVGIDTDTPPNKLTVVGDINATGTVYAGGSALSSVSAGDVNAQIDRKLAESVAWADANVADNITLTNITQITNRAYSNLSGLPHIPTDTLIDSNVWAILAGWAPLADANVSNTLTIGASGSVADGALSANVDLLNAAQTVTGDKTVQSDFNFQDGNIVLPQRGTNPATAASSKGQLFFNTGDNNVYVYDGSAWVLVTNQGGGGSGVSAGDVNAQIDRKLAESVAWGDANVADNITLTNITQITNRAYSDLSGLPHIPTDTLIDSNVWAILAGWAPLADANVSDTITVGASGSVNDSALSANVGLLNAAQTTTGDKTIQSDFNFQDGNIVLPQRGTNPATAASSTGQLFFNTGDNNVYVYDGSAWVLVTNQGGGGGGGGDGVGGICDNNDDCTITGTLNTKANATLDGNLIVDTNVLFVDVNGDKVGIGTANPAQVLHVTQSTPGVRIQRTNATGPGYWDALVSHTGASNYGSLFLTPSVSTGDFIVRDSSNNIRLYVDTDDGNVGINTASPTVSLDVNGNVIFDTNSGATLTFDGVSSTSPQIRASGWFYHTSAPTAGHIFSTGNTERVRIEEDGDVGIGTTPSARLDVAGGPIEFEVSGHSTTSRWELDKAIVLSYCMIKRGAGYVQIVEAAPGTSCDTACSGSYPTCQDSMFYNNTANRGYDYTCTSTSYNRYCCCK